MKILITNDDGIASPLLELLVRSAAQFGEVTVVAPAAQCSSMSQRITTHSDMVLKKVDYPVEGVEAYSLSGTPADCVRIAAMCILTEKPDVLFSGINRGCNVGYDIGYSGTVGAALEGLKRGIRSFAFSNQGRGSTENVKAQIVPVIEELLGKDIGPDEFWNVNFPNCAPEECLGLLYDRSIAPTEFYECAYITSLQEDGSLFIHPDNNPAVRTGVPADCDIAAVQSRYIAVGKVKSMVLG